MTPDTTLGDAKRIPGWEQVLGALEQGVMQGAPEGDPMFEAMMREMPLHALKSFSGGAVNDEMLNQIVGALNAIQQ